MCCFTARLKAASDDDDDGGGYEQTMSAELTPAA